MTHLRIHFVYLALLGFLAYQYWTKTQALNEAVSSVERFDKLLKLNNLIVDRASITAFSETEKLINVYQNERIKGVKKRLTNMRTFAKNMNSWLDSQKIALINASGGFGKKDTTVLVNHFAQQSFFTNQKIQEIRDSLTQFQRFLNDVPDSVGRKDLQKRYTLISILNDNSYWQQFKNRTVSDALAQLTAIQNRIELDKFAYIEYTLYSSIGCMNITFNDYKVAIAPTKSYLMEGDTMKAYIYVAQYSSNTGRDVQFIVNNREVSAEDGVVNFEKRETTLGKKVLKATVRIRNPLTGQIKNSEGSFEYEVFPKCRYDCK